MDAADDPVDALGQFRPVVLRSIALGQFVGLSIMVEGLLVVLDVVEVLSERVVKADFLSEWLPLCQQGFGAPEPGGILAGHLAMRRDAGISGGKIRIDGDRSLK